MNENLPLNEDNDSKINNILKGELEGITTHGETFSDKEKKRLSEERFLAGINEKEVSRELVKMRPDLDGRAAIFLLDLAGIKYNKLTFVKKGDWLPGNMNIDTGGKSGFIIEKDGTIFIDHHTEKRAEKGKTTSATSLVYDELVRNNFLEKSEWINNLVEFVNGIDNANYKLDRDFFLHHWSQSFYGLHKMLPFDVMVEYFRKGRTAERPFTDREIMNDSIKTINGTERPIRELCEKQQKFVEMNIKEVKLAENAMIKSNIKTKDPILGKIVVNHLSTLVGPKNELRTKNKIPLGFTAARALGYDSYVILNDAQGGFFITSTNTLDKVYEKISKEFPDSILIRGTMIIKNQTGKPFDQEKFLKTLDLIK